MKLFLLTLLLPVAAQSAYYELGLAGNYRKLYLPTETNQESFDATVSYTGSFAYYFAEMAAAELSYTRGQSERFVSSNTVNSRTLYDFSLIGLDMIFTFAKREEPFIPYVKAGVAQFLKKDVTYEFINSPDGSVLGSDTVPLDKTLVPSLGVGMKFRLTRTLAFKIGLEAWTADSLERDPRWDMAARAGISWFL